MRNEAPTHRPSLTAGPVERLLRSTSAPLALGLLATLGFQVIDALVLAKVGGDALTALGIVTPLQFAVSGLAIGLSIGASSVVARAIGAHARDVGERGQSAIGLTALVMSALATAGIVHVEGLLSALGSPSDLRAALIAYLVPWFIGIALLSIAIVGNGLLRATGDTRTPARIMVGLAVANAVLDPILVLGVGPVPGLGLAGAGWASLVTRAAAGAASLLLLSRRGFAVWRPASPTRLARHLAEVSRIALPAGAAQLASPMALFLLISAAIESSEGVVAALGAGGRLQSLWLVVALALSMATAAFVGQNLGAGELARVRRGLRAARRYALAWGAGGSLVFVVLASPIAALFFEPGEARVALADFLRVVPLGLAGRAWTAVAVSALNASGLARRGALLTFVQTVGLELPLGLAGLEWLGGMGLFAGLAAANTMAGFIADWTVRPLTRVSSIAPDQKERTMTTHARSITRRRAVVAALAIGLLALAAPERSAADATATVRAEPARLDTWQDTERVTGTLRAVSRADLASQEAGLVVAVHFDEGDRVKRGDLLVELDARRLADGLEEARAAERLAEAVLEERSADAARAEADRARFEHLFEQNVASERTRTRAVTDARAALARVVAAERALDAARARASLLETRLADTRVAAPFDGTVVRRGVEPGEWVVPGTALFTVVSDGKLEAWLDVPERHAVALGTAGTTIDVEIAGERISSDAVRRVPEVDPRARTFPIVVTIDNRDRRLAAGMSVTARVPRAQPQRRITVPRDAVILRGGVEVVYRLERDPAGEGIFSARSVPVSVVAEEADRVAIDSELRVGDAVVTEGNTRLADGQSVTVTGPAPQLALLAIDARAER